MVAKIPLNRNLVAFIDDEDFERVARHKWHARRGNRILYAATGSPSLPQHLKGLHSLVLQVPAGVIIDHRNGNGLDNRRSNLRPCTSQQNTMNSIVSDSDWKTSKFKGVCARGRRWIAQITLDGERFYLGTFNLEDDAARAYDAAAIEKFGEFALTNEMMGLFDGKNPADERRKLIAGHTLTREEKIERCQAYRKGWIRRRDKDKRTPQGVHEAYSSKGMVFYFPPGTGPAEGILVYGA